MSRLLVALLILAAAVAGLAVTARAQQEPSPTEIVAPEGPVSTPGVPANCPPDRILVKVKPGADPVAVIARYGGTIINTISGIDVQVVTVPGGTGQQAIIDLSADPEVQYAEPDGVVRALGEGAAGC